MLELSVTGQMERKMTLKNMIACISLISAAAAATIGVAGCEETLSGTDVELPYREELIVQGFLTADDGTDTILITRTLHPLEKWSIDKAAVTDATVSVTGEGTAHPLEHVGNGRYVILGLRPVAGRRYTLNVAWKNLKVTATAFVPATPEVLDLYLDTIKGGCDYYFEEEDPYRAHEVRAIVEYVPHEANMNSAQLGISYSYNGTERFTERGYNDFVYQIISTGTTNRAVVNQRCYSDSDPYVYDVDTLHLRFFEYEASFRDFYETRWNGHDDDLFFGPSGVQPLWNVTGDGFGWFFGRSAASHTTVLKK